MRRVFIFAIGVMFVLFGGEALKASSDGGNMVKNPNFENVISIDEYKKTNGLQYLKGMPLSRMADGWGIFMGGAPVSMEWGVNSINKKDCFYLKLIDDIDQSKSRIGLIMGDCTGLDGKTHALVNNSENGEYYFSFLISGTVGVYEIRILSWKEGENAAKHNIINFSGKSPLSENWEKVEGSFKLPEGTTNFAIATMLMSAKKGDHVSICDAVIKNIPTPKIISGKERIPLKVGVYANEKEEDAASGIIAGLSNCKQLKMEKFSSLKKEDLFKYDVVILSNICSLSQSDAGKGDVGIKETDYVTNILEFIDSGRGLILGYNCIGDGIWGKVNMFPEFIKGCQPKNIKVELKVTDIEHQIIKDLPKTVDWAQEKTFTFRTEKAGEVLVRDQDNNPVLAASKYPRGRIVTIGFNPVEGGLSELEQKRKMLEISIMWAGSAPFYETDPAITSAGLLAAVKREEANNEMGDLSKYINLPKPKFDEKIMFSHIYRIKTPEQIRKLVKNVKEMGFDGLIVNSFLKNLSYPSKYYDKKGMIAGFDQLEIMVEECKKNGLKYGFTFGLFQPCRGTQEPEEFPRNIPKEDYLAGKKLRPEYWACPDYPGVQERGLNVVREQLEKYHPDYMYLDFIRYIDDYSSSCYCEYSRARKKEFAEANPNIKAEDIDATFSEKTLTEFTRRFYLLCKEFDPKTKTILYTMTPNESDDKWLFKYSVDWHTKYVSRSLIGMWKPIDTVEKYTVMYNELNRKKNPIPDSEFLPMIAGRHGFPDEPCKSAERLEAEIKLLSATLDKLNVKHRMIIFYEYMHLLDPETYEVREDYKKMFTRLLK